MKQKQGNTAHIPFGPYLSSQRSRFPLFIQVYIKKYLFCLLCFYDIRYSPVSGPRRLRFFLSRRRGQTLTQSIPRLAEVIRELFFESCQVAPVLHSRPIISGQISLVCRTARSFSQNISFSEARGENNFVSIVMHGAPLHGWVEQTVIGMS